jgi:hypothetical protein
MNNDTYHHMVDLLLTRGYNALARRGIIALARKGLPAYPTLEQVEHHLQRAAEEWERTEGGD